MRPSEVELLEVVVNALDSNALQLGRAIASVQRSCRSVATSAANQQRLHERLRGAARVPAFGWRAASLDEGSTGEPKPIQQLRFFFLWCGTRKS